MKLKNLIKLILIVTILLVITSCKKTHGLIKGKESGRPYQLYVPKDLDLEESHDLVVMLHGCTQNATIISRITSWNDLADEKGFIILYPEQTTKAHERRCWNWYRTLDDDFKDNEIDIIYNQITKIKEKYKIKHTFLQGISAGGAMVSNIAVKYSNEIDAIGITAGIPYKAALTSLEASSSMSKGPSVDEFEVYNNITNDMKSIKEIPTIVFQGAFDFVVHHTNSDIIAKSWALVNKANEGYIKDYEGYEIHSYKDNQGKELVKYYLLEGVGHIWPNGNKQFYNIDATTLSYEFWQNSL